MRYVKSDKSVLDGRRAVHLLTLAILLLGFYAGGCSKTEDTPEPAVLTGEIMGTRYDIRIVTGPDFAESEREKLATDINNLFVQIHGLLSVYDENSEITSFNNFSDTGWFPVSTSTARVVANALDVSALTGGAFDITVGPLVRLWGLGSGDSAGQVPSEQQIALAKQRTGYHQLLVLQSSSSLKKKNPDIHCDPAALARGFAVDRISGYLKSSGYSDHLVEIDGKFRASGLNEHGTPWQVSLPKPDAAVRAACTVPLSNASMATSGDYSNYFEKDGQRYSRLLDPRTGWPISHNLISVVIIDESCMRADAMATAINVLGPQDGYDLAVRMGLAAMLTIHNGDVFTEQATPRMEKYLGGSDKSN